MSQKPELRQQLLAVRAKLMTAQRLAAQQQVLAKILALPQWQQANTVAIYWPVRDELNPLDLLTVAPAKHFYLPILTVQHQLNFARYQVDTVLVNNKYKIAEPQITSQTDIKTAEQLDIIFVPMVGFDTECHRLGMGQGYYDKTLAPVLLQPTRPSLIGLAFACQHVETIPADVWDIPLDMIITENKIYQ
jgi:5-formyltetrahydrofolate cyclo-ligase